MDYKNTKNMKKKSKAYSEAMKEASIVRSPANVLKDVKHKGKILGKYNELIY